MKKRAYLFLGGQEDGNYLQTHGQPEFFIIDRSKLPTVIEAYNDMVVNGGANRMKQSPAPLRYKRVGVGHSRHGHTEVYLLEGEPWSTVTKAFKERFGD